MSAVRKAAAELRGERVSYTAPWITGTEVASAAAVENAVSRQFQFVTALGTIEDYDDLAQDLRQRPGIVGVSGSERIITPVWDPARMDEAAVRRILAELGHPVAP
jgi:hypothetical protein